MSGRASDPSGRWLGIGPREIAQLLRSGSVHPGSPERNWHEPSGISHTPQGLDLDAPGPPVLRRHHVPGRHVGRVTRLASRLHEILRTRRRAAAQPRRDRGLDADA